MTGVARPAAIASRRIALFPIVATSMAAFALSLLWYSQLLFGSVWLALSHANPAAMPLWKNLIAPLRELTAAFAIAWLVVRLDIRRSGNAAALGAGLWLVFHAVQMAGAVIWDNMPWQLGAVHAGDWLAKMLFMSVVLSVCHRRGHLTIA